MTSASINPVYKRILLKLSGESLMGKDDYGINKITIEQISQQIKSVVDLGVQVAIVIGGGNIFRGGILNAEGMNRTTADYIGMLATVMNALSINDVLMRMGVSSRVLSALPMQQVAETYSRDKAIQYLEEKKVVVFAAGTGNPFFTTDTAAALRSLEIDADILLKATKVDGVYSDDPLKNKQATRYSQLSFDEAINKNLKVMDMTAFALCREQKMNLKVFSVFKDDALRRVVLGEDEGSFVHCNT